MSGSRGTGSRKVDHHFIQAEEDMKKLRFPNSVQTLMKLFFHKGESSESTRLGYQWIKNIMS